MCRRCSGLFALLCVLLALTAQTRLAAAAGGAASDLADLAEVLAAEAVDCVSTTLEFKEAFERWQKRCVSPGLIGRVISARNASGLREDTEQKLAYFWSASDALAKYLTIGYPESLGFSTPSNASGLETLSSGLAFLQQVGYAEQYMDVGKVYQLRVTTRSLLANATRALAAREPPVDFATGLPPFSPTWAALRLYFEAMFAEAGLQLPDEALELLQNSSFAELTGCPGVCTYVPADFPSKNQTVPVVVGGPETNGTCPPAPAGALPTQPDSVDETSQLCDADWQQALADAKALFPAFNCGNNTEAGQALAQLVAQAAGDARRQALLFRAFLMQFCAGGFYSPFSGDGLTYTGLGGRWAPLGAELVSPPFEIDPSWVESGEVVTITLCPSATNGGRPNADGICQLPGPVAAAAAARAGPSGRRLLRV